MSYKRFQKNRPNFKKIKNEFLYESIIKMVYKYVVEGLGHEEIENIFFDKNKFNFRGWVFQSIRECLLIETLEKESVADYKFNDYIKMKKHLIKNLLKHIKEL